MSINNSEQNSVKVPQIINPGDRGTIPILLQVASLLYGHSLSTSYPFIKSSDQLASDSIQNALTLINYYNFWVAEEIANNPSEERSDLSEQAGKLADLIKSIPIDDLNKKVL